MSLARRISHGFAASRPGGWLAIHVANRIDRVLLPATRGRISVSPVRPVGILETVGAKSGKRRRIPLVYVRDGENIALVASMSGNPRHPAWYHNLRANPEATFISVRGKRDYVAREAQGSERDRLWDAAVETYAGYEDYQERTGGRRIPIIVLKPKQD
jgi:deazaflavin-dependent oxidoreductase (nitroreductase family)